MVYYFLSFFFFFFCLQDPVLWACLATMAAYAKDLNTAETAYAAIDEVCIVTMIQLFSIYNHLQISLHRREPRPTSTAEKMAAKSKDGMSKSSPLHAQFLCTCVLITACRLREI